MIAHARSDVTASGIEWRPADAASLPFESNSTAAVVCQFGLMFVPDNAAAVRGMHRVLEPSGRLWVSVWDSMDANPPARVTNDVVAAVMQPDPPPLFRIPHGMSDAADVRRLFQENGFPMSPSSRSPSTRSARRPSRSRSGTSAGHR